MEGYKRLLARVNERTAAVQLLKFIDTFAVCFTVCAYAASIVAVGTADLYIAVRLILISGIPFVLVSLVRGLIDAPRPYEVYTDIYTAPPKKREGNSFPSRHAFSVFAIGTELLFVYPAVAAVILVLGGCLAVSRVLRGVHFLRDVLFGALLGAFSSALGMIILYL